MHYLQPFMDKFVKDIETLLVDHRNERFPNLPKPIVGVNEGSVYWKIVTGDEGGRRLNRVYAFVRKDDGAILKPATWNAPQTKTKSAIRGYIHDPNPMQYVNPYGVNYAR